MPYNETDMLKLVNDRRKSEALLPFIMYQLEKSELQASSLQRSCWDAFHMEGQLLRGSEESSAAAGRLQSQQCCKANHGSAAIQGLCCRGEGSKGLTLGGTPKGSPWGRPQHGNEGGGDESNGSQHHACRR